MQAAGEVDQGRPPADPTAGLTPAASHGSGIAATAQLPLAGEPMSHHTAAKVSCCSAHLVSVQAGVQIATIARLPLAGDSRSHQASRERPRCHIAQGVHFRF